MLKKTGPIIQHQTKQEPKMEPMTLTPDQLDAMSSDWIDTLAIRDYLWNVLKQRTDIRASLVLSDEETARFIMLKQHKEAMVERIY